MNAQRLTEVISRWRRPSGFWALAAAASVAAALLLVTLAIYLVGGARSPYTHLMYLPILMAALAFEVRGALLAALLAGLLLGPWMPVDVGSQEAQLPVNWLSRIGLYMLIGSVAGVVVHLLNERLDALETMMDRLTSAYARMLSSFAETVELRDEPTRGHCARVAHNACLLGNVLELDKATLETLYWAGLLHDLGKIAVPEHILQKPGSLTKEEYDIIKKHAGHGANLLNSVSPDFMDISLAVRHHHERWDGHGYPEGLAGESIPLTGRILAIIDVFEALTSERPYRQPMPVAQALSYVKEHAGSHFDPALVPVFETLVQQNRVALAKESSSLDAFALPRRFGVALTFEHLRSPL